MLPPSHLPVWDYHCYDSFPWQIKNKEEDSTGTEGGDKKNGHLKKRRQGGEKKLDPIFRHEIATMDIDFSNNLQEYTICKLIVLCWKFDANVVFPFFKIIVFCISMMEGGQNGLEIGWKEEWVRVIMLDGPLKNTGEVIITQKKFIKQVVNNF